MNWFKKLFQKKKQEDFEVIGEDDPNVIAMVNACWKSGKPMIGSVDESGNLKIYPLTLPSGDEKEIK